MTEFVFGRDAEKKNGYIIEKMKKALQENKKIILITPEQQALFWDGVCARELPKNKLFSVDTLSFTRLADNIFRTYGGAAKNYISEAGKTLIMWSALVSVNDKLKAFRARDREDRYAPLFLRAVNEMKMYSLTPSDLLLAEKKLSGKTLKDKLSDLATVYSAYEAILQNCYDDPSETLDEVAKILDKNNYFEGYSVFIDSFFTLTPKQMKIASYILRGADDVTVTFATRAKKGEDDSREFVWSFVSEMEKAAARAGIKPTHTELFGEGKEEFSYLFDNLWDYTKEAFPRTTDRIELIKCNDRYDEASLASAKIKKLIKDGAAFSDIAVCAADFDALSGITDTELLREGIPVYVSGRTPVTSQAALRLILCATATVAGGFKRDDIISLIKTRLTDSLPDECDAFEKYTETWNLRGKRAYTPDEWGMNPAGYTDKWSDWGHETLRLANKVKNEIIPPIEAFSEAFPGKVYDVCRAAYKLLSDFGVYKKLKDETEKLSLKGDYSAAQEKSQVFSAVTEVLETLADTVPDTVVDAGTFSSLLRRCADNCSIGTIPDGLDRVSLGSVSSMRLDGFRHIIVLGARQGEFPALPKDDSFFTENDREVLEKEGIVLSPGREMQISEGLFRFAYTVSAPSESLTLMIPTEGGASAPSVGAEAVCRLFPSARLYDFCTPEAEGLCDGDGEDTFGSISADADAIERETAENLFGKKINMTQSRIETFNGCAFKFYCNYILKLDEGKKAELDNANVGTLVHYVAENFLREAKDEEFPIPEDVLISRAERLINEFRAKNSLEKTSAASKWTLDRLGGNIRIFLESLNREFAQSEFRPYGFELAVGYGDELPTIPLKLSNGADLRLSGIVDRLDVMKKSGEVYLRVADYKTGNHKIDLRKIREGKEVQLMLYLFSLCATPEGCEFRREIAPGGEKLLPAGAIYVNVVPDSARADSYPKDADFSDIAIESVSREGVVLHDESIVTAMDKEGRGLYAPAKLKADGTFSKTGSKTASFEDFESIKDDMISSLIDIGNSIVSGEAGAQPDKDIDPCNYCNMRPLCRHTGTCVDDFGEEGDNE